MNKIIAISVCLAALVWPASAQEKVDEKKTQELKQLEPIPPATGRSAPEQAGTQEPATKGKGPIASDAVLVNGKLNVPGAAADGQAVPAKYSARNAALDKLPTVAFTLHHLTEAQRREIFERLHSGRGALALSPGYATLGAILPADIALSDVKPVSETLTTRFPELRGIGYLAEEPNVLLVGSNNVVIGVLSAQ